MAITTDIFGIEESVTQSGILGEYRTSSEIRIRFVIENAGVSSQFTVYGRIKGQTAWNSITTLTANEIKDVTVAEFDFIMIVCDVYSSTSNTVHFLASGIAQSAGGLSTITAGGNALTGLENVTIESADNTVTITSNTSSGVIDLAVAGIAATNTKIANLITLSGVAANATNLGTFTGSTISDNSTNKAALQALETAIDAMPDPMEYKGLWSAATNTPTLTDGGGNNGDVYQVTADGSVNFGNGAISFVAGDKCVYNGTTARYEKWDMTDAVSSVNGYVGAVNLVKGDISLGNLDNTSDANKPISTATQTALDLKVDENAAITGATKTKITYDAKGLVTAGTDATTADITDSSNRRYVTDANLTVINNTSGTNTGDQSATTVTNTPAGNIAATTVQAAINELDTEKEPNITATTSADYYRGDKTFQTLNSTAVGLGNVTNTSDANKPVSTAQQTALDLKANLSSPTFTGTVSGISAAMVGLDNVDNTSDATKNAASVTLTNKTINASSNTISNLTVAMLASGVLDTDISSTSGSDDTLPSAKAVKSYVDVQIGVTVITGDIAPTSFSAANNQAAAANVTGFVFNAGVVRTFHALASVTIVADANLYESFSILGLQKNGSFDITIEGLGDTSGVVFTITSGGQLQYTSTNITGFVSSTIKFRAVNLGI